MNLRPREFHSDIVKCDIFLKFSLARLVKDIEDPSLVPEYWVCSMNTVCFENIYH